MNRSSARILLAAVVAAGWFAAGSATAAPLSPSENTDFKLKQQHDARDVQTGNFMPHGTLSAEQRNAFAKQPRLKSSPPSTGSVTSERERHKTSW